MQPYWESHGQGRPILLVPGFGATTYTWRHLVGPLARRYRVILIDLKGAGRSPKPLDDRYSVHDQADMLKAFIVEQGLEGLTLIGHSLGGGVTLATTIGLGAEQRRLARLVLIDTIAYRQRFPWFITLLRTPLLGLLALWAVPPRLQVRLILRYAYHDPTMITQDTVEAYARPLHSRQARRALRQTAAEIVPRDIDAFVQNYASIRLPTLILWGRHDPVVPLAVGERLHRTIVGSTFVVLERSGHLPHEEEPARALDVIGAFLEHREAAPGSPAFA